jgi:hypothetical protein
LKAPQNEHLYYSLEDPDLHMAAETDPRGLPADLLETENWGRTKVERRQLRHELKNKVVFRP